MDSQEENKVASIARDILGSVWAAEKSTWKTASRLGIIGGVIFCMAGGFAGNHLYGALGMVGGAVAGGVVGWFIFMLVFYFLLSTASFFG